MAERGKFIVFEGLDGSGKTTQLINLERRLVEAGIPCKTEQEPSKGAIGVMIRETLSKKTVFEPETLALLFAADRYEHVTNVIMPELEKGVNVLCDRYVFSSLAYQGAALSAEKVIEYNDISINKLMPDLTIFINASPETCSDRIKKTRTATELFEGDIKFSRSTRASFLKSFEALGNKSKVKIIDGDAEEEIICNKIWEAVNAVLCNIG